MNLSVNLQMRQSQSLVMTPQLLQSIRLLQFQHAELQAFLEREAEANPLIELEPGSGAAPLGEGADAPDAGPAEPGDITPLTGASDNAEVFADAAERTGDGEDKAAPDLAFTGEGLVLSGFVAEDDGTDRLGEGPRSLRDHALGEICDTFRDARERALAQALFCDLTEAGYLAEGLPERTGELGLDESEAAALLERLQASAEPAGLFARDLAECLAIQLRRRGRFDPVIACVLAHLPLLARRDFAALARLTGETESDVADMLTEIRTLDPRPGAGLGEPDAAPVTPDIVVREDVSGGGWQAELNPAAFPRLSVRAPASLAPASVLKGDERGFLTNCQQSANWLQRSLEQRARTIQKVAGEIVRRQDGFLAQGIAGLRPMTLMDIAETLGLHESTVSRVTAGKFMATPRGTFEMKFFFTVAIAASGGGDAHSAESVKLRIGRMIAAETVDAVLSDDDIAARLKTEGVELARRTVAKYREALGLPSSVQRRRELNARRLAG
ncbi:RNA polymerase factor sigma-54 [Aureimonas sp. AU40]|uniref:RNA polymerase factor sigma-54 n=1 Tax=Aureimonas sp. AU40 TaxID=1637747 RepID=UPI000783C096|nr:RNA polymerase factor sigma-54 [Aureimonas sp. AU40]